MHRIQVVIGCVVLGTLPTVAGASCLASEDSNSEKKKAVKKSADVAPNEGETAVRRAENASGRPAVKGIEFDREQVERFVEQHQQELGDLLGFLREKQPIQYERAMREIARTMTRLETLERRDVEMHAIELELWQIKSQQRLVAAEWAAASKVARQRAAESRLKRLLEDEQKQDLKKLTLLQKRARAHVEKLTQQIKNKRSNAEAMAEKGLRNWKARIDKESRNKSKVAPSKQATPDRTKSDKTKNL